MEENENSTLQDILLDKTEDKKSSNIRKILTIVAAFVILFLVVLIGVKYVSGLNHDEISSDNIVQDGLILPDDTDIQNSIVEDALIPLDKTKESDRAQKDNNVFEQVPIISDNSKDNFENIIDDYKNSKQINQNVKPKVEIQEAKKDDSKIVQINPAPISKPILKQEPKKVEHTTPIKRQEPKKVVHKAKPVKKEVKKVQKQDPKSIVKNLVNKDLNTYVQVASVGDFDPNSSLVKKIKSKGYDYRTYETSVKGRKVVKILIGPFSSSDLRSNLDKIRKDINKQAFPFKIK